jgi:hypothetical protein
MDGLDEISSIHGDKVLSKLMENNLGRVWVTSRPVAKDRLERKLSVIAWSMKKLSLQSQESILREIFMRKVNLNKYNKHVPRFIDISHKIYADKNIAGTPGYMKVIATVLELVVEMQPVFEGSNIPNKVGFSSLYDEICNFMTESEN